MSDEEQERRFQLRLDDPMRRWKLSPMDLESTRAWVDYSRAKDEMFVHTDIPEAPGGWSRARTSAAPGSTCISHLLSSVPYEHAPAPRLTLPPRPPPRTTSGRRGTCSATSPTTRRR